MSPLRTLVVACCVSAFAFGCATKDPIASNDDELAASEAARADLQSRYDAQKTELDRYASDSQRYRLLLERRVALDKDLRARLKSLVDAGQLTVGYRRGLLILELPNAVLFDSGKFNVKSDGEAILKQVAEVLATVEDRRLLVSGHTDTVPIKDRGIKGIADNWELSTKRAHSVVKILTSNGVPTSNLGIAGFSEYDPVADNSTEEGRARNRRIEIVLIPNLADVLVEEQSAAVVETSSL